MQPAMKRWTISHVRWKAKETATERTSTNGRLRQESFEIGLAQNLVSQIGDVDQREFLPRGAVTF